MLENRELALLDALLFERSLLGKGRMYCSKFSLALLAAALFSFIFVVTSGTAGGQVPKASSQQSTPTLKRSDQLDESKKQTDDVVRIETDLANVFFTAVDRNRRFITTIQNGDIRVVEDGVPQEIFTFQRETNRPLSLTILIDVSASQQVTLQDEKNAAIAFVNSIVHHARDEVAVVSFSGEATVEQELTNNAANVRKALEGIEIILPPGYVGPGIIVNNSGRAEVDDPRLGTTAIWDAVWVVSEELFSEAAKDKRRAIILITDGVDTRSRLKADEAIKRAIIEEVAVYVVGIGDDIHFEGIKKSPLRKLAERTGGRAYFPRNNAELTTSFAQIEQELRSQYLVAYSPSNKNRDGSYRKVEIELINPELRKQKLQLNYRQGYFARNGIRSSVGTP
jgi:Ca-activated chloride channel family protein